MTAGGGSSKLSPAKKLQIQPGNQSLFEKEAEQHDTLPNPSSLLNIHTSNPPQTNIPVKQNLAFILKHIPLFFWSHVLPTRQIEEKELESLIPPLEPM